MTCIMSSAELPLVISIAGHQNSIFGRGSDWGRCVIICLGYIFQALTVSFLWDSQRVPKMTSGQLESVWGKLNSLLPWSNYGAGYNLDFAFTKTAGHLTRMWLSYIVHCLPMTKIKISTCKKCNTHNSCFSFFYVLYCTVIMKYTIYH